MKSPARENNEPGSGGFRPAGRRRHTLHTLPGNPRMYARDVRTAVLTYTAKDPETSV
jgi:hypothetical protein